MEEKSRTPSFSTAESPKPADAIRDDPKAEESGQSDSVQNTLEQDNVATDDPKTTGSEQTSDDEGFASGLRLLSIMLSLVLVFFLVLLDTSIISTAIPRITSDFHSLNDVGWYGSAYQLASSSLQPLTGKFYAHFNTKWTFMVFVIVFEIGSVLCGAATSSVMFIVGRAIAGLGTAGLQNGALTILSQSCPMDKRPLYTGILIGCSQIGIIIGPLIGGALTQYTTWRWCFYINLPAGGVALLFLIFQNIPQQGVKHTLALSSLRSLIPQLDLFGFALFAPASVMFLLALEWGSNTYPWNSSVIIGLFCGAGVTILLFIAWEWRVGDKAMIPGSIVKQRVVWSSAVANMLLMTTIFILSNWIPTYFQAVKGATPTMSGVYMLPSILAQLFAVVFSGALVTKVGYPLIFILIASAGTATGSGLLSTWTPDTTEGGWIGYQILLGATRGLGMQMALVAVQASLPVAVSAISMSFMVFCQNFTSAVNLSVANTIFDSSLTSLIAEYAPSVSPHAALAAGSDAAAVRALVPVDSPELAGVLLAFSQSFDKICYLAVGCAVVSFVVSWGIGFVDIRKKKAPKAGDV